MFWSAVVVSSACALVFLVLWRRANRLIEARENLWRAAMRLLQSGNYSDVQALAQSSAALLPEGATTEIGAALQAVAQNVRQHETARRELEDVLSSLQDAVLVVDAEARLRFLNAPALQLFHVRIEDVLGAQLLEVLPSFGLDSSVRAALHEGRSTMREQSLYFSSTPVANSANGSNGKRLRIGQIPFPVEHAQSSTENGAASLGDAFLGAAPNIANNATSTNGNYASSGDARREIFMRVAPVRSSLGNVAGAVAILQDMTEMRRLERVRRDFVANASHELRTPIANIRAGAETILTDPEDSVLAQRFLPQIVAEAERLSHLVSDLLDLAHADAAVETPRTPVNICDVIDSVVLRLHEKAVQNAIDVRRNYTEDARAARVAGDFAGLEQIAFNLLDNALIYTPANGKVELSLRVEPTAQELIFSISDTGIGIPSEDQERVFERFYRVDKARSRAQGGTGLGLAIVKHIVENHHGSVSVQSAVDHGTIFVVRLPLI